MSGKAQIRQNLDAACAIERNARERARDLAGLHARAPNHDVTLDALLSSDDKAFTDVLHGAVEMHVNAQTLQTGACVVWKLSGEHGEQFRSGFDEMYFGLCGVDSAKIVLQHDLSEFRERTGHFDASGPAADNDHGELFFDFSVVGGRFGLFEGEEHFFADRHRIIEALQTESVPRPLVLAEVARFRAERDDEEIVIEHAIAEMGLFGLQVDARDLPHERGDVFVLGEDAAQRLRDLCHGQSRSGDLIQQRLEEVMIPTIDERDAEALIAEFFRTFQAGEAAAKNEHMGGFHEKIRRGQSAACASDCPRSCWRAGRPAR